MSFGGIYVVLRAFVQYVTDGHFITNFLNATPSPEQDYSRPPTAAPTSQFCSSGLRTTGGSHRRDGGRWARPEQQPAGSGSRLSAGVV